jgi:hypothetical protein
MAYKFQIGDARLSGSLVQEGNIEIADGGTIGSDTTADVISIASNGAVTFTDNSQNVNIAGHDAGTNGLALGGTLVTATAAEINLLDTAAGDSVVNGKAVIYGDAGEVSAASLKVTDLTNNRVLIAGTSGEVEDSANLTFDGTILTGTTLEIDAAELSGTLEFMLDVAPNGGIGMTPFDNSANVSDLAISASYLQAAAVADGDEFLMLDSDGSPKREAIADLATLFAGNGLSAASSVMALDLNELSAVDIASGDFLPIVDSSDNTTKKESIDDIATLFAGDGLAAASAVLAVQVSGAVHIASDKVSISGSITGDALDFAGGVDSISAIHVVADESTIEAAGKAALNVKAAGITETHLNASVAGNGLSGGAGTALALDLNELSAAAIASGDSFAFIDADDSNGSKKETVDDLAALFAGNGLSAASAVMALDLNELSAAAVDVAADSIAIIDGDDSNGSKKESIADLVAAMAGDGLTATSGVLSVDGAGAPAAKADGDTLIEGYNYFADLSANATVTMPASPEAGDVVTVKARDLTSGANIIINRAGSHLIDGETSIRIESPFGAVSMVYVTTNDWRIV